MAENGCLRANSGGDCDLKAGHGCLPTAEGMGCVTRAAEVGMGGGGGGGEGEMNRL